MSLPKNTSPVIQVGDNQDEVVDELDAGGRAGGRIGPDEGDAQRLRGGGGGQVEVRGALLAGSERPGDAFGPYEGELRTDPPPGVGLEPVRRLAGGAVGDAGWAGPSPGN